MMKGKDSEYWIEKIFKILKELLLEVLDVHICSFHHFGIEKKRYDIEKEKNHWDDVFLPMSDMCYIDSHTFASKNVFISIAMSYSPFGIRIMNARYNMIENAISKIESREQYSFNIFDDVSNYVQKLGSLLLT